MKASAETSGWHPAAAVVWPLLVVDLQPGIGDRLEPIFSPSWRSDHLLSWRLSQMSFPRSDKAKI